MLTADSAFTVHKEGLVFEALLPCYKWGVCFVTGTDLLTGGWRMYGFKL